MDNVYMLFSVYFSDSLDYLAWIELIEQLQELVLRVFYLYQMPFINTLQCFLIGTFPGVYHYGIHLITAVTAHHGNDFSRKRYHAGSELTGYIQYFLHLKSFL